MTQVFEGEKKFDLVVPLWRALPHEPRVDQARSPSPRRTARRSRSGSSRRSCRRTVRRVIFREDGSRYTPVKFSVRGRDLSSTIADAQKRIKTDKRSQLDYDMHLEWGGEINEMKEANARLAIVIPITLLIIAFLVHSAVKTWKATMIVLAGLPVACSGGVLALFLSRTNFSVSAAMGFISILGNRGAGFAHRRDVLPAPLRARAPARAGGREARGRAPAAPRPHDDARRGCSASRPAALSHGIGSEDAEAARARRHRRRAHPRRAAASCYSPRCSCSRTSTGLDAAETPDPGTPAPSVTSGGRRVA